VSLARTASAQRRSPCVLRIEDIAPQSVVLNEVQPSTWLDGLLGVEYSATDVPVRFEIEVGRVNDTVDMHAQLVAPLRYRCVRCNVEVDHELNVAFRHIFVRPYEAEAKDGPKASEDDEEDLEVSAHDGESVDLEPICREQVVLALPAYPVCEETCRGLCADCGADLNREPCTCGSRNTGPFAVLAESAIAPDARREE